VAGRCDAFLTMKDSGSFFKMVSLEREFCIYLIRRDNIAECFNGLAKTYSARPKKFSSSKRD
jgi:hypothetical protein